MIKLNKKIVLNFLLIGAVIVYCSFVLAGGFGIYSDYGTNNPLIVAPGGKATTKIELMNGESNETMRAKVELLGGEGIATLTDSSSEYSLPYRVRVPINVKVSIPAAVAEGDRYTLTFKITDITPPAGGGMVSFSTSSIISFDVLVQKPTPPPTTEIPKEEGIGLGWWILGILVIIALIVIIYFIIKSRRK